MNLFGKIFGKSVDNSKKNLDEANKTLHNLKDTIETLNKRDEFIEKNIQKMKQEARVEAKSGNKIKALHLLKKIKMSEKEQEHIYGMIQNIELQAFTIERSLTTKEIVSTMKDAKNIISNINVSINVDEVTDIVDNIAEKIEDINEVGQILSTPFIRSEHTDEELLQELTDEINDEKSLTELEKLTDSVVVKKLSSNEELLKSLEDLPIHRNNLTKKTKEEQELEILEKELENVL